MTRRTIKQELSRPGRKALVTGASDGIGRATAEALARSGFDLIICARRGERLGDIAREIEAQASVKVEIVCADLGTEAGLAKLRSAIGPEDLDVAVLAAGFGTSGPFESNALEVECNMLTVNCEAVLVLAHDLAGKMMARGSGQIVLFGSVVGFQGNGGSACYSATKAWVQSFAEGLRTELSPHGVHVLSVAPGPVRSGFEERAGMNLGPAENPEIVAAGIVRALGKSGTIRPGIRAKLLGWSLALMPRPLRIGLMTRIMAGMTANRKLA